MSLATRVQEKSRIIHACPLAPIAFSAAGDIVMDFVKAAASGSIP
jgi:hypothetical protein